MKISEISEWAGFTFIDGHLVKFSFFARLLDLKMTTAEAVAADAETRSAVMSAWARVFRSSFLGVRGRHILRQFLKGGVKVVHLAEGPIDRCGLAFFLCNKFTNVCVLSTATETWAHDFVLRFFLDIGLKHRV